MRKAIKYLRASLLLFVLAGAVHAEEDKWIDGIKIRYGTLTNATTFSLKVSDEEGKQDFIEKNSDLSHLQDDNMFPIGIALPETLMNSWSFRGAVFEYQDTIETKDLAPLSVDIDKRHSYK